MFIIWPQWVAVNVTTLSISCIYDYIKLENEHNVWNWNWHPRPPTILPKGSVSEKKHQNKTLRDRSLTSNHSLLYATPTLLVLKSHSRKALLSLFTLTPSSSIKAHLTILMNSKLVTHSKPCICLNRSQSSKFKCTNDFIDIKDGISMRLQQPYRSRCFKHCGNASIHDNSEQRL